MKRWVATLALAAGIASTLGGRAAAEPAERGSVRIGLLDPASGSALPEGRDVDAGFRYYLATHGDRLGGFRVEIRTGDEGPTVDTAVAVAHRLVEQDGVDAVIGIVNSNDAVAVAEYLEAQKKPLIVTGAGADELTQGRASKMLFRVGHTSSQDVMPLGDYVCRVMGRRRAAIVATDYPYGWEAAGGFARAYVDAGCRVVQEQYGALGTDWSGIVAKVDPSSDVVFAALGYGVESTAFLAAYRAAGKNVRLVGDGLLTDDRLLPLEGERALGIVTALHYSATAPVPENIAFRKGFEALDGRIVSYYVENGYVAAAALALALARLPAGPVRSEALVAALRTVRFDAPRGPVRFDASQQVVNDVFIRAVRQVGGRLRNDVIATVRDVGQYWHYDPARYLQFPTYAKLKGTWARP